MTKLLFFVCIIVPISIFYNIMTHEKRKKTMNDFNISKNFKLREFACKDGSNLVKVDKNLLNKLQALRDRIKRPIIITSGYRTESHNRKVGGSKNSQHLYGKAVDIKVSGM